MKNILILLTLSLLSLSAYAKFEDKHMFWKGQIGALNADSDDLGSSDLYSSMIPTYGMKFGAQLHKSFHIAGAIFFHQDESNDLSGGIPVNSSLQFTNIFAEFNYTLDGYEGFYIGPRLGFSNGKTEVSSLGIGEDNKDSGMLYGLQIGYNFPLAERFTLGLETSYSSTKIEDFTYDFIEMAMSFSVLF